MTGTLGLFSLVDLFQLLAASSRTGRLAIDHPRGPARVYFDHGRVVHAEFVELAGEEAIYALFAQERGSFEFSIGLAAPTVTVTSGTENLVLEAIRRLDESRRDHGPVTISSEAVPIVPEQSDRDRLELAGRELAVFEAINGDRTVLEIAIQTDLDPEEVRRVVDRLVKVGALKLRAKKPRTARLVTKLVREGRLAPGVAGLDRNIMESWAKVIGFLPVQVACRRASGRVDVFRADPVEGVGPYIHFTRDTLFKADLAVDEVLLVKPVPRRD